MSFTPSSQPRQGPNTPDDVSAQNETTLLREEIEASLASGASVLGELYQFCEDDNTPGALVVDFNLWKENPAGGIAALEKFETSLSKPEQKLQKDAVTAMITKVKAYTDIDKQKVYFSILEEHLSGHRREMQGGREKREGLGSNVEQYAAESMWEDLAEGIADNPVPVLIGAAALLMLLSERKDNPVIQVASLAAMGGAVWMGLSPVAEAAGFGDLGVNKSVAAVRELAMPDEQKQEKISFSSAADKIHLKGDAEGFKNIAAAFLDVPTKDMVSAYYSARQENGLRIDIDSPLIRDAVPSGLSRAEKEEWSRTMYSALDQIFGGRYKAPTGKEYEAGALAALYQESDLAFGSFLFTMATAPDVPLKESISTAIDNFTDDTADVVAEGIVSTVKLGGKAALAGWLVPIKVGDKIFQDIFATENPDGTVDWLFKDQEFTSLRDVIDAVKAQASGSNP